MEASVTFFCGVRWFSCCPAGSGGSPESRSGHHTLFFLPQEAAERIVSFSGFALQGGNHVQP